MTPECAAAHDRTPLLEGPLGFVLGGVNLSNRCVILAPGKTPDPLCHVHAHENATRCSRCPSQLEAAA